MLRTSPTINLSLKTIILLVFCLVFCVLIGGCGSRQVTGGASIEFIRVPRTEDKGTDTIDIIEGRVIGARPGQQIVLYARSGTWWVQPLASEPFTKIESDSKWTNTTHLGTEYAALLVEPGYRPAATVEVLPKEGDGVVAVKIANAEGTAAASKTLQFSGYEWRVRSAPSSRGGMNIYDPDNAWTDASGALHLRIAKSSGQWTCAEVSLTRSFGYGSYSFVVRDTSQLDPAAVFGMFTWDYAGTDQNHREMDIEISRWGDPVSKNAQYVVQPYYVPANVSRFMTLPGTLTHVFRWEPGRVSFMTVSGSGTDSKARAVGEHVFTSGVPAPGIESVRMNLYVFNASGTPMQNEAEVVIEKFEYLP